MLNGLFGPRLATIDQGRINNALYSGETFLHTVACTESQFNLNRIRILKVINVIYKKRVYANKVVLVLAAVANKSPRARGLALSISFD